MAPAAETCALGSQKRAPRGSAPLFDAQTVRGRGAVPLGPTRQAAMTTLSAGKRKTSLNESMTLDSLHLRAA